MWLLKWLQYVCQIGHKHKHESIISRFILYIYQLIYLHYYQLISQLSHKGLNASQQILTKLLNFTHFLGKLSVNAARKRLILRYMVTSGVLWVFWGTFTQTQKKTLQKRHKLTSRVSVSFPVMYDREISPKRTHMMCEQT